MPVILVPVCLIILVISVILLYFLFFKKEKYSPHNLLNKQCNNTGYFVDSKNTCVCIDGWSGKNCTISDCNNNGKIVTDGGISKCVCNPGYNGDHCQYSDAITCNGNGTVDNKGKCTCVAGKHGKFCANNCLYGNIVDDKCICNTEKMFSKSTYKYFKQNLYEGQYCNLPVKLSNISDMDNIYKNELPSDDDNENDFMLKICPFNKNVKIQNFQCQIDGVPVEKGSLNVGLKDSNDCYIIDPSVKKLSSWLPDCTDSKKKFDQNINQLNALRSIEQETVQEAEKVEDTSLPFCSPLNLNVFFGQNATVTLDVIGKNLQKESGKITFVRSSLSNTVTINVTGLSNYYIRKGVADRILSAGSKWKIPTDFAGLSTLHTNHDENARSYNIIIGEPICTPMCSGKNCGDDGCGGSCGICQNGIPCNPDGTCCVPKCDPNCGQQNGCGGYCVGGPSLDNIVPGTIWVDSNKNNLTLISQDGYPVFSNSDNSFKIYLQKAGSGTFSVTSLTVEGVSVPTTTLGNLTQDFESGKIIYYSDNKTYWVRPQQCV